MPGTSLFLNLKSLAIIVHVESHTKLSFTTAGLPCLRETFPEALWLLEATGPGKQE